MVSWPGEATVEPNLRFNFLIGGLPYGKSPVASGIESLSAHIKAGHRLPKPPNCSEEM